jgi:hypothetical protein
MAEKVKMAEKVRKRGPDRHRYQKEEVAGDREEVLPLLKRAHRVVLDHLRFDEVWLRDSDPLPFLSIPDEYKMHPPAKQVGRCLEMFQESDNEWTLRCVFRE